MDAYLQQLTLDAFGDAESDDRDFDDEVYFLGVNSQDEET